MSEIVVYCSVAMAWCFEDEDSAYADQVLDSLRTRGAVVPGLWLLEVANVLLVAERRGRITIAASERFLGLLGRLPIEIDDAPGRAVAGSLVTIGRRHSLSAYDSAYLDLAVRRGASLATLDASLRRAATASGVPLFGE